MRNVHACCHPPKLGYGTTDIGIYIWPTVEGGSEHLSVIGWGCGLDLSASCWGQWQVYMNMVKEVAVQCLASQEGLRFISQLISTFQSFPLPQRSTWGWVCKALQCGVVLAQEDGKNGSCTSTKWVSHQNQTIVLCSPLFTVAECSCKYCLFFQFVPDVFCCLNHPLQLASFSFKIQFNGTQMNAVLKCEIGYGWLLGLLTQLLSLDASICSSENQK